MDAFFAEAVNFDLVFVPNTGGGNFYSSFVVFRSKLKDMNWSGLLLEPGFLVIKVPRKKFFL